VYETLWLPGAVRFSPTIVDAAKMTCGNAVPAGSLPYEDSVVRSSVP
jgi:hypothetical protein